MCRVLQRIISVFLVLFFCAVPGNAGNIDSLEQKLKTATDTQLVFIQLELSKLYRKKDIDKGLAFSRKALEEAQKTGNKRFLAKALIGLSSSLRVKGEFKLAFESAHKARVIMTDIKRTDEVGDAYNTLGLLHFSRGNYDSAVYYYTNAVGLWKQGGREKGFHVTFNNIANVYYVQKNFSKAIEYYKEALKICKEENYEQTSATIMNNLGAIYDELNDYKSSIEWYNKALEIATRFKDDKQMSSCFNNLGVAHKSLGRFEQALEYYQKTLDLDIKIGDREGVAMAYFNIGTIYQAQEKHTEAVRKFDLAYKIANETGYRFLLKDIYGSWAETEAVLGNYKKAFEFHREFFKINDSLFNEEKTQQIIEVQEKYDTEKKEQQIELLNKDKVLKDAEVKKQTLLRNSFIGGFAMVFLLAFVLFRSNKTKQKANRLLEIQKAQVQKANDRLNFANHQISAKNQEITDSINYAKRIQEAILPEKERIKQFLPDSFFLYLPKDIVSGDFYWFSEKDDVVYLAVADCTGHGVPGALMSMIGCDKLNEAVAGDPKIEPGQVLIELDGLIRHALKQSGDGDRTRDGMDIGLVRIDVKTGKISFSGANRNLLIINSDKKISEIKSDKFPIGGEGYGTKIFTTHSVEYQKGDCIYLFTDGFPDQIGGNKMKKLMSRNFKEKLLSVNPLPMDHQQQELKRFFFEWKGEHEQVDDVLVGGFRI